MRVGIIGAGNLGRAFIDGFKEEHDLLVSDVFTGEYNGIAIITDNKKVIEESEIILLIVKPQVMQEVITPIAPLLENKLVISFAAGITIAQYQTMHIKNIARAMPNIAVSLQEGVIGYASTYNKEQEEQINQLFSHVGKSFSMTEEHLDVLTGISGSGIAYLIEIAKSFIEAGKEEGMHDDEARTIIAQTFQGAASLLAAGTPEEWLEKIASKDGTTEQGLLTLREKNINGILKETVSETIKKCQDLSKSSTYRYV